MALKRELGGVAARLVLGEALSKWMENVLTKGDKEDAVLAIKLLDERCIARVLTDKLFSVSRQGSYRRLIVPKEAVTLLEGEEPMPRTSLHKFAPTAGTTMVCAKHRLPLSSVTAKRTVRAKGKTEVIEVESFHCPVEGPSQCTDEKLVSWKRPIPSKEAQKNLAEFTKDPAAYVLKCEPEPKPRRQAHAAAADGLTVVDDKKKPK
jgi:hypothetical protein